MIEARQSIPSRTPMARWLTVLEAFAARPEWGIRDLAVETGLSRSSVHRIVREMVSLGLLTPASAPGRSRVGPALSRLAVQLTERVDVVRLARPALDHLRDVTGETAILALYDRSRRQFRAVAATESAHPIRYIWESLQSWSDVHLGASGKGILAFLPHEERAAILSDLTADGWGSDADRAALREQLEQARHDGWVISHGERYPGAVGVSAPVRDASGRVIGNLLLGWPDNRTDTAKEHAAAVAVAAAAGELSAALGYVDASMTP